MADERKHGLLKSTSRKVEIEEDLTVKKKRGRGTIKKQEDGSQQSTAKTVAAKEAEEPVEMEDESGEWVKEETLPLPVRNWKRVTRMGIKSVKESKEEELCKDHKMQEEEENTAKTVAAKKAEEPVEMEDESGEWDKEETLPLPVKKWKRVTRMGIKSVKESKEEELCKDHKMQEEEENISNEQQRKKSRRCVKPTMKLENDKIEMKDESGKEDEEGDTTPPVMKKKRGTGKATKSNKVEEEESILTNFMARTEKGVPKKQNVTQEGNKTTIKKKSKPNVKRNEEISPVPCKIGKKKGTKTQLMQMQVGEKDVALPSINKGRREAKITSKTKENEGKTVMKPEEEEDVTPVMPKKNGRATSKKEESGVSKPVQKKRGEKSAVITEEKEEILSPPRRRKKENEVNTMEEEFGEKATQTINKRGKKHIKASKENEDVELETDESPAFGSMTQEKGKVNSTAKTTEKNAKTRVTKKILTSNMPAESGK